MTFGQILNCRLGRTSEARCAVRVAEVVGHVPRLPDTPDMRPRKVIFGNFRCNVSRLTAFRGSKNKILLLGAKLI